MDKWKELKNWVNISINYLNELADKEQDKFIKSRIIVRKHEFIGFKSKMEELERL